MTATSTGPTIRQRQFMESLARDLGWYQPELNAFTQDAHGQDYLQLTTAQASDVIDRLIALNKGMNER